MPQNDGKAPTKGQFPVDSGHGDGIAADIPDRRGGGWLDMLTPSHARFLIFPIFPGTENDREARALKIVGLLALLAVAIGSAFTVGRHYAEGRAFMLLRAQSYEFERRSTSSDDEAAKAARAFRSTLEKLKQR
jgi:hypothetical protein